MLELTGPELVDELCSPWAAERLVEAGPVVVVEDLAAVPADRQARARAALASLPILVVGDETGALCDVVADDESDRAAILATAAAQPVASVSLAVLLRGGPGRSPGEGLAAESAVYSLLQSGPEFATWRAGRPRRTRRADPGPAVIVARQGELLHLTLNRPQVHNAFNAALRDQLIDAATVAAVDGSIRRVVLDGAGPSFCSGGDLDEFGTFVDPARAHLVRLRVSAARALARVADQLEVHLHGACLGSGIELAALAARVVAHPDTRIGLPEIGLGLIPGAGGTVSLPARIGRHRTAHLALSGAPIGAETALAWGLVDEISAGPSIGP